MASSKSEKGDRIHLVPVAPIDGQDWFCNESGFLSSAAWSADRGCLYLMAYDGTLVSYDKMAGVASVITTFDDKLATDRKSKPMFTYLSTQGGRVFAIFENPVDFRVGVTSISLVDFSIRSQRVGSWGQDWRIVRDDERTLLACCGLDSRLVLLSETDCRVRFENRVPPIDLYWNDSKRICYVTQPNKLVAIKAPDYSKVGIVDLPNMGFSWNYAKPVDGTSYLVGGFDVNRERYVLAIVSAELKIVAVKGYSPADLFPMDCWRLSMANLVSKSPCVFSIQKAVGDCHIIAVNTGENVSEDFSASAVFLVDSNLNLLEVAWSFITNGGEWSACTDFIPSGKGEFFWEATDIGCIVKTVGNLG